MSCCCGSENLEVKILVIGSNEEERNEIINLIQNHLDSSETSLNLSFMPAEEVYPGSCEDNDMALCKPLSHSVPDDSKEMEKIKRYISKTAHHVFLLLIKNGQSKEEIKKMVENIKAEFGEKVTKSMILVVKGEAPGNEGTSIIKDIDDEEKLKFIRCVKFCSPQEGQSAAGDIMENIQDIIRYSKRKCYTQKAPSSAEKEKQELRIVVIGSIDAKKKEVIDMIRNHPRITDDPNETKVNICCSKPQTESYAVRYERRDMILFDPPGLCDPNCNGDEMEEIRRCISKNARHVFLLVLDVNFTEENKEMLEKIESTFGENIQENMIIVFKLTQPCDEPQIDIIKREVFDLMKFLYDFAVKCERRCVDVVKTSNNESAVKQIMDEINKIITISEGKCYTYKMLKTIQKKEEKTEKLSMRAKIGLLVGLWIGALLGLIFFGKDFLQTGCVLGGGSGAIMGMVGPAAKKRLEAIKERI
uniref:GTPase IMAP family member 8-like n=1 Tax=Cyprinodon variegatus TaxID=28743 RepID=A0A3Q2CXH3_CYPVA